MTATTKLEKPWVTNTNCSKLKAFWYQHEGGGGCILQSFGRGLSSAAF